MDVEKIVSTALEHEDVADALVTTDPGTGSPLLLAETPGFLTGLQLRQHLDDAGVTCPDLVVVAEEMTRDAAGAPDTVWLAETIDDVGYRFVPPEGAVEQALAECWQSVLHSARVGVEDDFVELGGDSFSAVLIANQAEERFGVTVSPADMYVVGTIRSLVAKV